MKNGFIFLVSAKSVDALWNWGNFPPLFCRYNNQKVSDI